ncbi:MAG: ATP-binding protein [Acidobacteria bacterium]|nr:ATP-binding protein [Acidobacteriota bacterium]
MFQRRIEKKLLKTLEDFRCVALTGARQVGKSYLLTRICKDRDGVYRTLDDPKVLEEANADPLGWLRLNRRRGRLLVIDEAAKSPGIFSAVKVIVDEEDPVPTKILLSSSGNYLLMRRIKESLAGRVGLIQLYPLSWSEIIGGIQSLVANLTEPDSIRFDKTPGIGGIEIERSRENILTFGGFPEIQEKSDAGFLREWSNQYFNTYILPMAVEFFSVSKQHSFQKVFYQLCLRTSNLLNYSDIATPSGISSVTVKNYIEYFSAMMICFELPQFYLNPIKRLVKSPKIHVIDPILINTGYGNVGSLTLQKNTGAIGPLYESWIVSELMKCAHYESIYPDFFTWHTQDGSEVDLVFRLHGNYVPIEIKYKKRLGKRDLSGLRSWLEAHDSETPAAYIVYPGHKFDQLSEKIWAIPDFLLLGAFSNRRT